MDRPNTVANSIIGGHGSMGPPRPTPTRFLAHPHWKMATITP
jgi:hypothetical protein